MEAVENWLPYERVEDIRAYLEKQKEQKHVEVRTPTDEEIEEARKQLHKFKVFVVKMADKHQVCFSYDHDFEWDNFCGEILYYLNGNHKPVEWSEEDENALKYLHELISFVFTEKFFDAQTAADMREWLNTRFKSLRPSWKPSEEQIEALENSTALSEEQGAALYSLLQDLKKL